MVNAAIPAKPALERGGGGVERVFAHEMLREIYEQPEAIRRTLALYTVESELGLTLNPEFFSGLAHWGNAHGEVLIAASGSSRHSGLFGEIVLHGNSARMRDPVSERRIDHFPSILSIRWIVACRLAAAWSISTVSGA